MGAKWKRHAMNLTQLCCACTPGHFSTPNCSIMPANASQHCDVGFCAVNATSGCTPTLCTQCSAGTFQPGSKSGKCQNCTVGTFSKIQGAAECALCWRGYYCNSSRMTAPLPCQPGYYCPDLALEYPLPCPPGYSCPIPVMVAGRPCDPGWYCRGGLWPPAPCPSGSYCPGSTAEPVPCLWLFQSGLVAASCSPSPAFFVVVVVSGLVVVVFAIWLWLKLSKRALERAERDRASEITGMIPKPTGPTYSGL